MLVDKFDTNRTSRFDEVAPARDAGLVEALQQDLHGLIGLMSEVNQHLGDVRMTLLGSWPTEAPSKGGNAAEPSHPMMRVSFLLDELRGQILSGLSHGQVLSARVR